jgi:hypothetical protein
MPSRGQDGFEAFALGMRCAGRCDATNKADVIALIRAGAERGVAYCSTSRRNAIAVQDALARRLAQEPGGVAVQRTRKASRLQENLAPHGLDLSAEAFVEIGNSRRTSRDMASVSQKYS